MNAAAGAASGAGLDLAAAAGVFEQLGNPTRLEIVRLLVQAGPGGLAVGEIQRALDIPSSTLSHHLGQLKRVDLLAQDREGVVLRCQVSFRLLDDVAAYLLKECCSGAGCGGEVEPSVVRTPQ